MFLCAVTICNNSACHTTHGHTVVDVCAASVLRPRRENARVGRGESTLCERQFAWFEDPPAFFDCNLPPIHQFLRHARTGRHLVGCSPVGRRCSHRCRSRANVIEPCLIVALCSSPRVVLHHAPGQAHTSPGSRRDCDWTSGPTRVEIYLKFEGQARVTGTVRRQQSLGVLYPLGSGTWILKVLGAAIADETCCPVLVRKCRSKAMVVLGRLSCQQHVEADYSLLRWWLRGAGSQHMDIPFYPHRL